MRDSLSFIFDFFLAMTGRNFSGMQPYLFPSGFILFHSVSFSFRRCRCDDTHHAVFFHAEVTTSRYHVYSLLDTKDAWWCDRWYFIAFRRVYSRAASLPFRFEDGCLSGDKSAASFSRSANEILWKQRQPVYDWYAFLFILFILAFRFAALIYSPMMRPL